LHTDSYFCRKKRGAFVESYLNELNESQRNAVINTEGPSLVIAGAGSGKTRVLTFRIAHLLQNGVKPGRVLSLTFTNKAAREMKNRIGAIVGEETAKHLWMGTFHSIFAKILRMESQRLGYPSSFTIYDTADSKSLIKSIVKEMKLNDKVYKPGDILGRISSAKNDLVTPVAYARDANRMSSDSASQKPLIHEIYTRYMRRCYQAGAMDFDDLLLNTNILFRDHPEVLTAYQDRFRYILVDEYQDTNLSQYRIIKKLAEKHNNICVVGDDAQSIYSFRGAKIENILNFRNDYPNYQLFKLEQNYRSTRTIVDAANSIIANNKGQIFKKVFSEKDQGNRIKVFKAYSDIEEGFIVANDIAERRMRHHYHYKDFAILYRTNAQSRIFEEALRKKNYPYKIYGGLSFYQRKEIKDLLAYFRLTVNPHDQESLKRVINYPARGIGATTLEKLEEHSASRGKSIWSLIVDSDLTTAGINTGTQKKLIGFVQLISLFAAKMESLSAYELAREIVADSGVLRELHLDKSVENQSKIENIEELINAIKEFTTNRIESGESQSLVSFLEEVSLLTDQDNDKDGDNDKVTMMTIHSAKGLEFKNVYVVGVEEGLFPSPMASESEQGLEEERRLFYVAVTRAEEYAALSFAKNRYKYGELKFAKVSRFIGEMDQQYLDVSADDILDGERNKGFGNPPSTSGSFGSRFQRPQQQTTPKYNFQSRGETPPVRINFGNTSNTEYKVSMRVEHERFGQGTVVMVDGMHPEVKITVQFDNAGTKQLLLKFAKLKILN
jgi:DNA helicase II / ATP-dependent DNA helicase PcrA